MGIGEPLLERRPKPPEELQPLLDEALRTRPEVKALKELFRAHEDTRDSASMKRLPRLALVGTVNYDNPNQRLFPPETRFYTTWVAGAEITWSPTDLATYRRDIDDAELEMARARQDLRALEDRITLEVSTAYENAIAADGAVEATHAAVLAAEESLKVRMALFRAGEATSRDVLDAELDFRTAQLDFVDNVLAAHVAAAALEHALGKALL